MTGIFCSFCSFDIDIYNKYIYCMNKKVYNVCYVYSGSSNVSLVLLTTPHCQGTEPASLHHITICYCFGILARKYSLFRVGRRTKVPQWRENQCARAHARALSTLIGGQKDSSGGRPLYDIFQIDIRRKKCVTKPLKKTLILYVIFHIAV